MNESVNKVLASLLNNDGQIAFIGKPTLAGNLHAITFYWERTHPTRM